MARGEFISIKAKNTLKRCEENNFIKVYALDYCPDKDTHIDELDNLSGPQGRHLIDATVLCGLNRRLHGAITPSEVSGPVPKIYEESIYWDFIVPVKWNSKHGENYGVYRLRDGTLYDSVSFAANEGYGIFSPTDKQKKPKLFKPRGPALIAKDSSQTTRHSGFKWLYTPSALSLDTLHRRLDGTDKKKKRCRQDDNFLESQLEQAYKKKKAPTVAERKKMVEDAQNTLALMKTSVVSESDRLAIESAKKVYDLKKFVESFGFSVAKTNAITAKITSDGKDLTNLSEYSVFDLEQFNLTAKETGVMAETIAKMNRETAQPNNPFDNISFPSTPPLEQMTREIINSESQSMFAPSTPIRNMLWPPSTPLSSQYFGAGFSPARINFDFDDEMNDSVNAHFNANLESQDWNRLVQDSGFLSVDSTQGYGFSTPNSVESFDLQQHGTNTEVPMTPVSQMVHELQTHYGDFLPIPSQ